MKATPVPAAEAGQESMMDGTTTRGRERNVVGMRPRRRAVVVRHLAGKILLHAVLAAGAVVLLFPMYWMISTSLKPIDEINAYPIIWIPHRLAWENYQSLFTLVPFWTYMKNSVFVTLTSVAGSVVSASLVGFAFARLRFPGRGVLFLLALSTLMIPGWVTLIPQFIMFKRFGWLDTFAPLIVPQLFANPAYLFLMRQFFLTLPTEIEDAAKIDGCGYWRIFWRIALPMVSPALIAIAAFAFVANWNDFLGPLIYLQNPDNYTLQVGLSQLQSQYLAHTELIMAGATLTVMPCVILFLLVQRWFIQGIVVSGVKG